MYKRYYFCGWIKQQVRLCKINCDASLKENSSIGVGFIIRNSVSEIIGPDVDRF